MFFVSEHYQLLSTEGYFLASLCFLCSLPKHLKFSHSQWGNRNNIVLGVNKQNLLYGSDVSWVTFFSLFKKNIQESS